MTSLCRAEHRSINRPASTGATRLSLMARTLGASSRARRRKSPISIDHDLGRRLGGLGPTVPVGLQHVHPEVPPHPRPPALNLTSVLDDAVAVADEVRLGSDRRHDERDVGLGERGAELPLFLAQQLSDLRIT